MFLKLWLYINDWKLEENYTQPLQNFFILIVTQPESDKGSSGLHEMMCRRMVKTPNSWWFPQQQ